MTRDEFDVVVDDIVGTGCREIRERWVVGGTGGGNCWEDGGHYSISSEPEPELEEMDMIIERVCPDITFLRYKKVLRGVKIREESFHEYYGNHTEYREKFISVDDLWTLLDLEND